MKLVPGCRIEMQGPSDREMIMVRDAREFKRREFVPWGHQALVIGVVILNQRDPMFSTWVYCFSIEHGFWCVESNRIRVIWSPED